MYLPLAIAVAVLALVFGLRPLRRALISSWLMPLLARIFPRMSETERVALDAGTVWWDAELFSGAPRWSKLLGFERKQLSEKEKAFLDGPVEELCRIVDDWEVQQKGDLPREAWDLMKRERFFGMIIPESFGGRGFSALANSSVVAKLSSHSVTASVTVMVPNSLGPAELLLHYGTEEQKRHYLPRLAIGEEVPCFALTEPGAGSDAGSMQSKGIVCRGRFEGKDVLGMRLTWNKRYITLSSVATLLGLAFKLYDPEKLLGGETDLGITCALIPTATPGVEHGPRHCPLSIPFMNGSTRGNDVFVPIEFIIGGPKQAGQGWRMLMECLSAGRSISLPGNSVGGSQLALRVVGAYATIREQFNMAVGRFEGIEAPLARIGGTVYWMNALRTLTAGAVDAGEKPAVISAIAKYYTTEAMRRVINDAMDIQGGAGISKGPRNSLATAYQATPIGITVEGANILTRSMIIFGQGAIRCHPYARHEMEAAQAKDLARFDKAFFSHVGFVVSNGARALVLGLTGGALASTPLGGEEGALLKKLARYSAAFALVSDACMGTLGGSLKRKEAITGRLADALAWMYIASSIVKKYVEEGRPARDRDFFRWAGAESLWQVQTALDGVLANLPSRATALALRPVLFPLGRRMRPPSDRLGAKVARALLDGGEARLALTREMYVPKSGEFGLALLERALAKTIAAEPARKKLREAVKAKKLPRADEGTLLEPALKAGILSESECKALREAAAERWEAVQVDEFPFDEFPGVAPARASAAPKLAGAR
ncbi:MAG: acyl-CoA dehydrogenase [Planctomycetes bacterium]|nr:acyl-CoA dehydrogenase [Planctomycetota bacterium]